MPKAIHVRKGDIVRVEFDGGLRDRGGVNDGSEGAGNGVEERRRKGGGPIAPDVERRDGGLGERMLRVPVGLPRKGLDECRFVG